jgi:hypothetical protein
MTGACPSPLAAYFFTAGKIAGKSSAMLLLRRFFDAKWQAMN